MPMQSEVLAAMTYKREPRDVSVWVVIVFCVTGLGLSVLLGLYGMTFNDLPPSAIQNGLG